MFTLIHIGRSPPFLSFYCPMLIFIGAAELGCGKRSAPAKKLRLRELRLSPSSRVSGNSGLQHIPTAFQSPGYTNPTTWQGTLCAWTTPHPGSLLHWILLQESPFLVTLTSQEQTSCLTRAAFIASVNNNHLRYNLVSENHLQVLSTPYIVCEQKKRRD